MTVGRLISILAGIDSTLEFRCADEYGGNGIEITHVKMVDGKVIADSGYTSEENFWHPGNGNLGRNVRLLGHEWPE